MPILLIIGPGELFKDGPAFRRFVRRGADGDRHRLIGFEFQNECLIRYGRKIAGKGDFLIGCAGMSSRCRGGRGDLGSGEGQGRRGCPVAEDILAGDGKPAGCAVFQARQDHFMIRHETVCLFDDLLGPVYAVAHGGIRFCIGPPGDGGIDQDILPHRGPDV